LNGGNDWKKQSEITQLYRVLILKFEKEGKDTSRLEERLRILDRKLWSRRKKASSKK
jgi:hypothetical protein